jgi:outer membrane immunogenic protein
MLKSIIASAALLSAFAVSANAADMVEPTETAPAPIEQTQPLFTWSGGYVGIQGGGTWANGDFTTAGVTADDDFNGGILGGFAGWNVQNGDLVYGIEGDLNYNWNDNDYDLGGGTTAEVGTNVSGAVRGRVGYAMNNALLYAAGGWTAARGYVDVDGGPDDSEMLNGFTVGAGLDYAFTDNMFGRVEYRYNKFGDEDIGATNVDFDQHQVTVGLGVKF